jgi:hypothetical protein
MKQTVNDACSHAMPLKMLDQMRGMLGVLVQSHTASAFQHPHHQQQLQDGQQLPQQHRQLQQQQPIQQVPAHMPCILPADGFQPRSAEGPWLQTVSAHAAAEGAAAATGPMPAPAAAPAAAAVSSAGALQVLQQRHLLLVDVGPRASGQVLSGADAAAAAAAAGRAPAGSCMQTSSAPADTEPFCDPTVELEQTHQQQPEQRGQEEVQSRPPSQGLHRPQDDDKRQQQQQQQRCSSLPQQEDGEALDDAVPASLFGGLPEIVSGEHAPCCTIARLAESGRTHEALLGTSRSLNGGVRRRRPGWANPLIHYLLWNAALLVTHASLQCRVHNTGHAAPNSGCWCNAWGQHYCFRLSSLCCCCCCCCSRYPSHPGRVQ